MFNFKIKNALSGSPGTATLDLGCGPNPRNPFEARDIWGIDVEDLGLDKVIKCDLVLEKIPFANDFFDFCTAFDFIEHIPRLIYLGQRKYPFVQLMNEIYRVLKQGGYFLSVTPCFPNNGAFIDPTHVNFITHDTWKYFDYEHNWAKMYGFSGAFKIELNEMKGEHLVTIMRKIKPKESAPPLGGNY